jgi:hypothetical protein
MKRSRGSLYALCFEPELAVRRGLLEAACGRIQLRFEERLEARFAERNWLAAIPPVDLVVIHLSDTRLETLARIATLRQTNPGLPVLLTTCYDGDFQLAADRLAQLSERIVFRPFEAEALITSMIDLGRQSGVV